MPLKPLMLILALALVGCLAEGPATKPIRASMTLGDPAADRLLVPAKPAAHSHPPGTPDHDHGDGGGSGEGGSAGDDHGHDHTTAHSTFSDDDPAVEADEGAISFRTQVVPVLRKHCADCHTTGTSGATALAIFDEAGDPLYPNVRAKIGRILLEIQVGRMPAGDPYSMSDREFTILDQWGAAGMPDN